MKPTTATRPRAFDNFFQLVEPVRGVRQRFFDEQPAAGVGARARGRDVEAGGAGDDGGAGAVRERGGETGFGDGAGRRVRKRRARVEAGGATAGAVEHGACARARRALERGVVAEMAPASRAEAREEHRRRFRYSPVAHAASCITRAQTSAMRWADVPPFWSGVRRARCSCGTSECSSLPSAAATSSTDE